MKFVFEGFVQPARIGLYAALLTFSCARPHLQDGTVAGKEIAWSFDKEQAGSVPRGWKIAETNGRGKLAEWGIVRDNMVPDKPQAVAITKTENSGHTYNLLIAERTTFKDLKVSVKVKAISGKQDQGGGPVWRAKDPNNYYIARWNPLEENLRVYSVKDGRRKQLASADVKTDPTKWHEIEIEHRGNRIVAGFDKRKLIEVEDATFTDAGMVGLWTKADAATAFDDFEVETKGGD